MELSLYEMVDRMCGITTMLADLVREQASVIAQADIPDETKEVIAKKRDAAYEELDIIEYGLRKAR